MKIYNEFKKIEEEAFSFQLSAKSYKVKYEEVSKDISELLDKNIILKRNQKPKWKIEMPKSDFSKLESKIKLCDKYTIDVFIEYLNLDSFNLVKNSASALNQQNDKDVLQYMDGALSRNQGIKEFFNKTIKENFFDRIKNKQVNIKKQPKK